MNNCKFCKIVTGDLLNLVVMEDEETVAFLDHRPLFPGHTLLVPKTHYETLADLPDNLVTPLFKNAKMLAVAVEQGLGAEGSFIAINNRISQSIPHLHVHIVPRHKGDGMKGFFWPRHPYESSETMLAVADRLRQAIAQLRPET
ncbi:MAG: HIT family protein [Thermacetogeniaceae bacterium]